MQQNAQTVCAYTDGGRSRVQTLAQTTFISSESNMRERENSAPKYSAAF